MRRLFINKEHNSKICIVGDQSRHLLYSMRTTVGKKYKVVDTNNKVGLYEVENCLKDVVELRFIDFMDNSNTESPIEIILAQGLPKSDKFEYVVQKAVELGVNKIIPLNLENCIVKYDNTKLIKKYKKWQKVADEASKQSGRTARTNVLEICDLQAVLNNYSDYSILICYEKHESDKLHIELEKMKNDKYIIVIGPEGGFSPQEITMCNSYKNTHIISLGPRILRTETAGIAIVSILQYVKGDI